MGYEVNDLATLLRQNEYPGRGIVVGLSADAKKAMFAYFIMGRSENSRNRIFTEDGDGLKTQAFEPAKMKDQSLIIYSPVRVYGKRTIVTNGDQTDTIYAALQAGGSFESALETRRFEPDAPNYTPRVSALLDFTNGFSYKMSILKAADAAGSACSRFTYAYEPVAGVGHFLHTYAGNGSPLPAFSGEPERVAVGCTVDSCARLIWENLNEQNKVSLFVRFIDIETGKQESRLINKNTRGQ